VNQPAYFSASVDARPTHVNSIENFALAWSAGAMFFKQFQVFHAASAGTCRAETLATMHASADRRNFGIGFSQQGIIDAHVYGVQFFVGLHGFLERFPAFVEKPGGIHKEPFGLPRLNVLE